MTLLLHLKIIVAKFLCLIYRQLLMYLTMAICINDCNTLLVSRIMPLLSWSIFCRFLSFEKQCNAVSVTFFSKIRKIKPILHFTFLRKRHAKNWTMEAYFYRTYIIYSIYVNKLQPKIFSPSYLIYIGFLLCVECTTNMCKQGAP